MSNGMIDEKIKKHNEPNCNGAVRAVAYANLALVKYFGKRDVGKNLPAASSLSISLEPLATETSVLVDSGATEDTVFLNGARAATSFENRVRTFMETVRALSSAKCCVRVETVNRFPTAAGLASSASGFAALALAATRAMGISLSESELSSLARRGSGSAARSIPGGVCVWQAGERNDGSDSYAYRIAGPDDLKIRVVVGVTDPGPKAVGSTEAMEHTRHTSPYYENWIAAVQQDIDAAVAAVEQRDIARLGQLAEDNAMAMHAAALAARPGILFWNGTTVEAIHLTRRLRKQGLCVYFTCDAGPQPKLLCAESDEQKVAEALGELPGVQSIIRCRLGGGARLLAPDESVPQ